MSDRSPAEGTSTRTQAQRERILAAAQSCFVNRGFRAASMATIAHTAGMSPGLIYRYFESKNAIILAIIKRQLEGARRDIATLQSDTDFVSLVSDLFARWQGDDPELMSPALMLDMTAEASRDPQILQALADSDEITGTDFHAWLTRTARSQGRELTADDASARIFALRCLIGGLAIRAIQEPHIDRAALQRALRLVLPQLLSFRN